MPSDCLAPLLHFRAGENTFAEFSYFFLCDPPAWSLAATTGAARVGVSAVKLTCG
jgi:hypothetical protein